VKDVMSNFLNQMTGGMNTFIDIFVDESVPVDTAQTVNVRKARRAGLPDDVIKSILKEFEQAGFIEIVKHPDYKLDNPKLSSRQNKSLSTSTTAWSAMPKLDEIYSF